MLILYQFVFYHRKSGHIAEAMPTYNSGNLVNRVLWMQLIDGIKIRTKGTP